MRRVWLFVFPLLLFCFPQDSHAQNWKGIIAPSRATDWSRAGATIVDRTGSVCATFNPGATAAQINAQLQNAACANKSVVLNAGTYNLSAGLDFGGRSNVTLRGAGANQTFLVFSNYVGCNGLLSAICIEGSSSLYGGSSGLNPDNTATWTATSYAPGQNQITLSSTTNLHVGNPLVLDQCNDGLSGASCTGTETNTGSVYSCDNGSPGCASLDGPSGGERSGRAQMQIVTVTAINGNLVTFSPPLRMPNSSASRSPGAYWSSTPNTSVGVENLSIDFTNAGGQANITIWNCYSCWVKGVRSVYGTHNTTSQRNHVWLVLSPHATVRDSYIYGSSSLHSEGYGVENFGSSDSLIENNIFQNLPSPQMINSNCMGCVIGYNYSINDANDAAFLFNSLTLHANVDYTLVEGNTGNSYRLDYFHGSHNFNTAFRNYYNGWETGISGGLVAVFINAQGRYTNIIGNVLGRTGVAATYQGAQPTIYDLGAGNGSLADDSLVSTTLMRWGNYDTVNAAVRFVNAEVPSSLSDTSGNPSLYVNPVPANQTLPPSFYYSAKPSWWPSSKPWPPIGPDVTGGNVSGVGGHVYTIPAQDCYSNVMGGPADGSGSVLTFNANNCYGSGGNAGGGAPNPPSGVIATVK